MRNSEERIEVANQIRYLILSMYALSFIIFGFIVDRPGEILRGLYNIIMNPDVLITDYITVGGMGACFVNSGLLTLVALLLLYLLKMDLTGRSIISIFLISGFALFGKNIANIWLIILGTYLYSLVKRESFSKHVNTGLLGTSMAPAITEIMLHLEQPLWVRVVLTLIIGLGIGFVLPPLSAHTISFHQGFNMYNVGFAAGILGTIIASLAISYGYQAKRVLIWSTGNNLPLGIFLTLIFLGFLLTGYILNKKSLQGLKKILRCNGRLYSDFVDTAGFGPCLINMGINGFIGMAYVLAIGAPLNGPTIGGILTIAGFGAYGKHYRNIIPILVGVLIGVITKIWGMEDPRLIIAALFGTALAPIAGEFGWFYGVIAGFINSSVVLSVGVLHGGMNLYNTGFSSGIVAATMVPILRTFKKEKPEKDIDSPEDSKEPA